MSFYNTNGSPGDTVSNPHDNLGDGPAGKMTATEVGVIVGVVLAFVAFLVLVFFYRKSSNDPTRQAQAGTGSGGNRGPISQARDVEMKDQDARSSSSITVVASQPETPATAPDSSVQNVIHDTAHETENRDFLERFGAGRHGANPQHGPGMDQLLITEDIVTPTMSQNTAREALEAYLKIKECLATLVLTGCLTEVSSRLLEKDIQTLVVLNARGTSSNAVLTSSDLIDLGHDDLPNESVPNGKPRNEAHAQHVQAIRGPRHDAVERENASEWLYPETPEKKLSPIPQAGLRASRWTSSSERSSHTSTDTEHRSLAPTTSPSPPQSVVSSLAQTTSATLSSVVCPHWIGHKCKKDQTHGRYLHELRPGLPVERLECYWWRSYECNKSAEQCRFEHKATRHGIMAPKPPGRKAASQGIGPAKREDLWVDFPAESVGDWADDMEIS
ncbi:hypothetical protein NKR23_g1979 [Pleurostoma richardsiae]|uniref:Uncharacterized protein n=1 Tax=Pleurostoma richardsiae TaxID=41990 RepID=A0AA38VJF9_9PEZI|nr:hypothetical protein NKR23_g1979 [Pleurostoma richardsiae]